MGVCTYKNPRSLKNKCVACANAARTRATAPIVLVRGRKCATPRRNSRVCRFFCSGYVEASHVPSTLSSVAWISTWGVGCGRGVRVCELATR